MKLLLFAHSAEASSFIKNLGLTPSTFPFSGVYVSPNHAHKVVLLVTGEGMAATFTHGLAVLSHFGQSGDHSIISEIINMGVAGSLKKDIEIGKIVSIRNVLHEEDLQTYPADKNSTCDCITALNRVTDDDYAKRLALKASIVDRELWAVAHMAQIYNIPFRSWKLISDHAGSTTDTASIKKNAARFSEQLFTFFKTLM